MLHLIGTYFPLLHVLSSVGYLFSCGMSAPFHSIRLSLHSWHCRSNFYIKTSTHTHKSCQLPSDKIYIRGAYLAQKSRRKHHPIRMHRNHFEIEPNLASAIANFRIICTTFIIIDLREFFHSTVWCVCVYVGMMEKRPKKKVRIWTT